MNITDRVNSLRLLIEEELAELQLLKYPMLNRVAKRTISQKDIKWNVNVGGAAVTGEATTADVTTFSDDDVIPARLPIGSARLRHSFQLQKEDIAEAATAGVGVLRDLFAADVRNGIRVIMETLSGRLYTGDGTNAHGGVVGLNLVTAAPNSTYANIDSTTYTDWVAYRNTNASNRALTQALLLNMEVGMATRGSTFTAIYTTPAIVAKYKELFTTNAQIQLAPAGVADLGYTGATYAGRPIIQDPY
ncbi:hypothetical protein Nos7524_3197 [Nostoc sp. PCC 7524]|uniref:phage major capsid protein n=1 Tax=Nostoc sp. (strain ATCC 29411 / PCC 7524) TaxID=28072 RepID=UPI00029F294C|nr:phage major capsid protein [Nostoc sp. PCC 7524]AFY48997.1 hypothetical protein Nos7524_3197 [Nostoc sp. PCC 7524]